MSTIYKVRKRYSNLKAAHRQWRHPGHCAFVHGENWSFEIEFSSRALDAQNFVVDFGRLRPVSLWLDHMFDHTLLIDSDDPAVEAFKALEQAKLADVRFVQSASAEGLAQLVASGVQSMLDRGDLETYGRAVWVSEVVCEEDSKNSAVHTINRE